MHSNVVGGAEALTESDICPCAQRYSMATLRPSVQPSSLSLCTNAAAHRLYPTSVDAPSQQRHNRNPRRKRGTTALQHSEGTKKGESSRIRAAFHDSVVWPRLTFNAIGKFSESSVLPQARTRETIKKQSSPRIPDAQANPRAFVPRHYGDGEQRCGPAMDRVSRA